jgi:cytochrome oxidase Cu insertion factor (SCO1/SenC/PrrC family)
MIAHALLFVALIPIHGVVLDVPSHGAAIVRNDAAPEMLPSEVRLYRLVPRVRLAPGTGVDAYVDRSTAPWTLRDPVAAGPFVPGLPNPGRVTPVDLGSPLPAARLVNQKGSLVSLRRAFAGKTLLLSFIFTRCPDRNLCPAISGKYAYLQSHLDAAKFALAEISLDPGYDSPAVLAHYGSAYGSDPKIWSFLTGEGTTIQRLLNAFGITSLRISSSDFIHSDKLFIVDPTGRVADIITTAQWDPNGVIAQANEIAGLANNPFERFKLSLVAGVVAACGGSQWVGVVLLELALFFVISIFVSGGLWAVARMLWGRPS